MTTALRKIIDGELLVRGLTYLGCFSKKKVGMEIEQNPTYCHTHFSIKKAFSVSTEIDLAARSKWFLRAKTL